MVHKLTGALALGAALLLSTSAMAQDKRIVTYNADYDPIPLAGMEALIADFEAANPDIDVVLNNFDHEGYKTAIRKQLKVMDATAFSLCMENNMPIGVFSMNEPDNIRRALTGEHIGTLVDAAG